MSQSMVSKERIYLTKKDLMQAEQQLRREIHILRYHFARQYTKGTVLDVSCGCGYGTYILTHRTPETKKVIGVDTSKEAIAYAKKHFKNEKNEFICSSIEKFNYKKPIDFAVSIETIEHLKHPLALKQLFKRHGVKEILLTYPTKRSTHYNPYHFHDFKLNDIKKLFLPEYIIYDTYQYQREFIYVFLKKK